MITEVSKALTIPTEDILGRCKRKDIALARNAYYWLLWVNGFSYSDIARLNGRSPATILQDVRKVNDALKVKDKSVKEVIDKIKHIKR